MKNYSKILLAFTLALTLTACSNEEDRALPANSNAPEMDQGEVTQEDAPEKIADSPVIATELPAKAIEIEMELEGMKEIRTGSLVESDNGYYMYTIPPFVFTPEEPNLDQVFMEKFPEYFMRIQALSMDTDIADIRSNAETELKMVSEEVLVSEHSELENVKLSLIATSSELVKEIIVIETEGMRFKFTINLPMGEPMEGAVAGFIKMIQNVKPAQAG